MSRQKSKASLYRRIAAEIASQISAGRYTPGQRIPSIRYFAEIYDCNKLTVQKAFSLLRQQGIIKNIVGSGSYVRYPRRIGSAGEVFDFRTDYIEVDFFPYQQAGKIYAELFANKQAKALAPVDVKGDPDLINVLSRQYHVPAERMIIISGAQQGLDLISKLFASRMNETILFEDPTYPGAISLFKAKHFVAFQKEGPDMKTLDRQLVKKIRLFYTMPAVHNPTGRSYSPKVKQTVARLANEHGFFIIEDDYLSEFACQPLPRFVDLVPENTIYIKSLSQTTVSGLRLGFMVVPQKLYDKTLYAKYISDIASNGLVQKFLCSFIEKGLYRQYLKNVAAKMKYRKKKLLELISTFAFLKCDGSRQQGYSLWIKADRMIDIPNCPWRTGSDFSFDPAYKNYFRISFMHLRDEHFEQGLVYLERLFSQLDR